MKRKIKVLTYIGGEGKLLKKKRSALYLKSLEHATEMKAITRENRKRQVQDKMNCSIDKGSVHGGSYQSTDHGIKTNL